MDTVSNLPFKLEIYRIIAGNKIASEGSFFTDKEEATRREECSFKVEENEEIEVVFTSEIENTKLFLEALDIVPPSKEKILFDDDGRIYRESSEEAFFLYKHNAGYDALCVDSFLMRVICNDKCYYSVFEVCPKPISANEWTMMKDDLEREVTGLAQDLVRRNIGAGTNKSGNIPPKLLHDFIVIQKYSKKILPALMDIANNPRYQIVTTYKKVTDTKNCRLDSKSVRRYISRAGSEPFYQVPEKTISYDIQDNRLIKKYILDYESRLNTFIEAMDDDFIELNFQFDYNNDQYQSEWERTIKNFKNAAIRLKKITALIRTTEWFESVSKPNVPYVPHSFIMDSRYNALYQMYTELNTNYFKIDFDPEYSYAWKKSSYLYEMWCYIKICRLLEKSFTTISGDLLDMYANKMFFPFLRVGSKVSFSDGRIRLDVVYDNPLPYTESKTDMDNPIYMAQTQKNRHNRPDILINIYDDKINWFLGSIVLECKYRKLNSFWGNNDWSSINQFQSYYNNARSLYQYGKRGAILQTHPIRQVIVLTPDLNGDGKKQQDFNIEVVGFKPTDDEGLLESLKTRLFDIIDEFLRTEELMINI